MGKIVFGKDISKATQEEKNELMKKMRSYRNGNGRTGYRMPDRQAIFTNNFPEKEWKPGNLKRKCNEHIKCIFICTRELYTIKTAYGGTKIYYVGFLTDSNKFSFEEFRDAPSSKINDETKGIKHSLEKYIKLFSMKNIDKDTEITLCTDGMDEKNDLMPLLLNFMSKFTLSKLRRVSKKDILKRFMLEYKSFDSSDAIYNNAYKYKDITIIKNMVKIYNYIAENKLCPWINEEIIGFVGKLSIKKKHSFVVVNLGLLYSLIIKFNRQINEKIKFDKKQNETNNH